MSEEEPKPKSDVVELHIDIVASKGIIDIFANAIVSALSQFKGIAEQATEEAETSGPTE